ncbi:MAG: DEAD/DEAH box helicase [Bdellovibrionales bacterium]|nr:DEAD/DEAH box helicase [Bdellovibrionales bacterium]
MHTFEELSLPPLLSKSLDKIGFVEPTKIQKQAIPLILEGKDVMACAETGSGKTGAYIIPMVKFLIENPKSQGLVLAPTRELAMQISDFLVSLISNDKKFHTTNLIGGQDIRKQFRSLQRKPRIIVATPGRLIDHLKRNTVQVHKVNHVVLDEGDRMIDMGFAPQLEQISKYLPKEKQTSFFTATLDKKVKALASNYLNNPELLVIDNPRPVAKIKQSVVQVNLKDKDNHILDELNSRSGSVIVFLKTKVRTDKLTRHLSDFGIKVDVIHGGRSQGQRNRAIASFKNGKTRVLCATDVAARGLDIPHVEHVINFDLPMQDEDYVHRVGRTARNGAEGEAISFVTPQENRYWNKIVKKYEIPDALLPDSGPSNPDRKRKRPKKNHQKDFKKSSGRPSQRKNKPSFKEARAR